MFVKQVKFVKYLNKIWLLIKQLKQNTFTDNIKEKPDLPNEEQIGHGILFIRFILCIKWV